jgi:hypothetical protein
MRAIENPAMPAEQLTLDRTREAGVVCDAFALGAGPAGSTVAALAARDRSVIHSPQYRSLALSPAAAG